MWFVAVLALAAAAPVRASSGGGYELNRSLVAGPAGTDSSGGGYSLIGALQDSGGLVSSSQTITLVSGYLILRSSYAAVILAQGTRQLKSQPGWEIGVSSSSSIELFFATAMASGTLAQATSVYLTADNLGNVYSSTVAFSMTYDDGLQAASLSLAGGWGAGRSYQIVVGTSAIDADFNALASTFTTNFLTTMDFSQRNVLRAIGSSAFVDIASNAFTGQGVVVFIGAPASLPDRIDPALIAEANAKALVNLGPQARPVSVVELNAYDPQGNRLAPSAFNVPVLLTLPYSATAGYIDGIPQARVKDLSFWTLDEQDGLWVRAPGASVGAGQVTSPLAHFSVYSIMALADEDVSQVYPFPVPWRPFAGNPVRYGTASGGITFANVPQSGTIKIFTLSGRLVRQLDLGGGLTSKWDGRNSAGEEAASGVYLWKIESGPNGRTGKLMIVR